MISVTSRYKSALNADHVVLFVPGFPGQFTKHEDLAEVIAAKLNVDTLLIQLSGLGSDLSKFSLCDSITEAAAFASTLVLDGKYKSYSIFGHSWGGLVALNMLKLAEIKPEKVILLSPLTFVPDVETLKELMAGYSEVRRAVGAEFNLEHLVSEIPKFASEFDPSKSIGLLKPHSEKIRILQSLQDDVIPYTTVRPFVAEIGLARYLEVDDNHYFLNRQVTIPSVLKLWHDHV